jgi:hypothetical protein
MEALLLVGIAALFFLAMPGGQQPLPKTPQVVYVVAEPHKSESGQGGCLLLLALGIIALIALGVPG